MRAPQTPESFAQYLARSNAMLNDVQRIVDDALHMAMLVVMEADGKKQADHERLVAMARGMLAGTAPGRTTYRTEDAMRDGKPTRGGMLRALTGWFNGEA